MRIIKFTKSKENKAIKVILFFSGLAIVSLFFFSGYTSYLFLYTKKKSQVVNIEEGEKNIVLTYYNENKKKNASCKLTRSRISDLKKSQINSGNKIIVFYPKCLECDIYFETSKLPTKKHMVAQFFFCFLFAIMTIFSVRKKVNYVK